MHLTTDPLKTTEATENCLKKPVFSAICVLSGNLGPISLVHPIFPKIDSIGRDARLLWNFAANPVAFHDGSVTFPPSARTHEIGLN